MSKSYLLFLLLSLVLQGGGLFFSLSNREIKKPINFCRVQVKTIMLNKQESKVPEGIANGRMQEQTSDNNATKLIENEISAQNIPYLTNLAQRIQSKVLYPLNAKRKKHIGSVFISFEVNREGKMLNIKVNKPSEHSSLNLAAINAIMKINEEPGELPPPELFIANVITLTQIIEFK